MMSRPVFVPSGKRRTKQQHQQHQQQQRFHGAFTGGFSAGYFNTVDTKEGWKPKPSETIFQQQQQQQMEDFMDEQDFNEWGGPTSVKKDFSERIQKPTSLFSLDPPLNVGRRLLRVLGWKEGEAAYVPTNEWTTENSKIEEDGMAAHLSARQLKRIRLQRSSLKLPAPKLDTCGLGYNVFLDAPEFQNHREQLRRKAQARTNAVTNKTGSNVYRLSDLNNSSTDNDQNNVIDEIHDTYQAHETLQDFVGTTSVGGFALREDDDDVYDSAPLAKSASAVKIDKEQYDIEIVDHYSDEEDQPKPMDVSNIFASWAATATTTSIKTINGSNDRGAMTSDGRAPLPGFILGSSHIQKVQERYPGPDIPPDFEMKRHVFEHGPKALQSESVVDLIIHQAKQAVKTHRDKGVMAGATFIGLAEAMKNRFSTPKSVEETLVHPAGLHIPIAPPPNELPAVLVPVSINSSHGMTKKRKIKLTRQLMVFAPNPLVCKRFHIRPPIHSVKANQGEIQQGAEATFFENEIMTKVVGAKTKIKEHNEMEEPSEGFHLPDMTVHQSIFQPESESSESEFDDAKVEVEINSSSLLLPPKPIGVPMPMSEPIDRDSYQQHKIKDERKKRRRRRRSSSSTDASLSSDDRRKRRKEKKHRKKEKSHHKKSSK